MHEIFGKDFLRAKSTRNSSRPLFLSPVDERASVVRQQRFDVTRIIDCYGQSFSNLREQRRLFLVRTERDTDRKSPPAGIEREFDVAFEAVEARAVHRAPRDELSPAEAEQDESGFVVGVCGKWPW